MFEDTLNYKFLKAFPFVYLKQAFLIQEITLYKSQLVPHNESEQGHINFVLKNTLQLVKSIKSIYLRQLELTSVTKLLIYCTTQQLAGIIQSSAKWYQEVFTVFIDGQGLMLYNRFITQNQVVNQVRIDIFKV